VVRREKWVGCHFDAAFKLIPKKIYIGQVRSQARWLRLGKLGAIEERDPRSPALGVLTADASGKLSMRCWSQKQLDLSIQFYLLHLKLKAGEIDLCQTPLQLLANLAAGLTSVIADSSGLLALAKVERRIEKFKPTRIAGESALVRRLLRKYSSPLHKVFITDAPLDAESVDFFNGHVQHANIELLFCSELPLASLSLRGFEEKGDASLAGSFFPEIQAGIISEQVDEEAEIETQLTHKPNVRGKLIIKSEFLPQWRTEPQPHEELAQMIEEPVQNGVWHSTGMTGFLDDQQRFWLVRARS
jgi:hypothetical protein